ncbi:MAG: DUF4469 domain-containing protein, partial [Prevotellaceae bacterium]|nr:DUF4469 domain-containing protein [Prevotellaceae bacterium]
YLYNNPLTEDPSDLVARVSSERTRSIKTICDIAVTRGGARIPAADMEHSVNLFLKEMSYQLCDGYSVNTGYFTATPLIRGVFNSPEESFNPDKHSVLFQFNQGELLRAELSNVTVEIEGVANTSLSIAQVIDVKSGSVNDLITPNRNLKIEGHKLKIAGDSEDNGVYFVNQATQERTKVEASDFVNNNPSELIIVIPELVAGTYKLEVVTQYSSSNGTLKDARTASFKRLLTVQ